MGRRYIPTTRGGVKRKKSGGGITDKRERETKEE